MDEASAFDVNFSYPLPESVLETARVKLTPFVPSIHGDQLLSKASAHPELARYLPVRIDLDAIETHFLSDPTSILFAIIDKTKGENGLINNGDWVCDISSISRMRPLIIARRFVVVFPEFQRTFVNSNAVGILLRYCLDLPKDGGLGLRRVQWAANPPNGASIRAAERMGMKREGTMRWTWVLPAGKEGKQAGEGRGVGVGRDSVLFAVCWDDWESGTREHVQKIIDRES
ncbi:hypothetical protein C8J57DRAFT_1051697 [Mycena rebaudengoi]|nr:hypothetical protein C8J57DRAFT_1051697 [Mycena rebaudengoi]